VIQPGDTLWDIAKKYNGITVNDLKQMNNHLNFKHLKPGMKIKVPVSS
jgi:membrane-bound lytic murein transglycosylase D